jgi:hypothetical protein
MTARDRHAQADAQSAALAVSEPAIMGLDIRRAWPCGRLLGPRTAACECGCTLTRIAPYSKRSALLIWKCPWCGSRRGRVSENEAGRLGAFVTRCGWNRLPLTLHENGDCYV